MMESHLDENPEMRASMIGTGELSQRRGRIPGSEYAASSGQVRWRKPPYPKRGQIKRTFLKVLLKQILRPKNIFEADAHGETDLEYEMLSTPNDVEADLSNQEIQVANSDDNVFEQDQANRGNNIHDGFSLMDVVEANADSENYSEHEILWNRNDVEANLGGQENEVTTGGDFEFERDQANRDSNNHDGSSLMDVLAWVFPITNFTLELPSAVLDQLSYINKPHYALILMLISFIALMACIGELICKGKKGRVTWQWRDRVPRFSGKPFDNPWEIIGFACACLQCVVTAINYSFVSRHVDGPIKTSALPILFAFGLLCSKYFEKPDRDRVNPDGDSAINLVGVRVEP
ncbi:Serine/threonine-protein kinase PBS1 [Theobroma cacao]|uniref:Serine/threonine-protein kinase PBS1 n=1 Tax=Theobroma cacao TaxID=3641 RepID=A0A061E497_THECC|nr:Serine/threonine-protein kinase PBS1 [Theobroma cacao]